MSKRKRRNRRSVVLRAVTLPLCMGLAGSLAIAAFSGPDAGFAPAARKSDRLAGMTVWTKPFQVASLNNDWMLHIVPAEIDGKPVLLAQADTGTPAPDTVTTQSISPASVADDTTTQLDKLALEAKLTKGYAELARKDYKAARKIFAEAVDAHPKRADLWRQLGYIDSNLGDQEKAVEDFSKAVELAPGDEQAKTVLDKVKTRAKLNKGYDALCRKDYKSAEEVFGEQVKKDPENADLWRQLGYIKLGLGKKDEALKAFEKANEIAPGDPQLEAQIEQIKNAPVLADGYKKLKEKDYKGALEIFQNMAQKEPKRSDLWKQIAFIQTSLGNSVAAAAAFDKSSEIDTAKVAEAKRTQKAKIDAKIEEAYTALCSKDFKTARRAYMEAVKIAPMRADLWQQLGSVETNLGNLKAASEAFDRARSLKPSN